MAPQILVAAVTFGLSLTALSSPAFATSSEVEVRVLGRITLESRRLHEGKNVRLEGVIKDDLGRALPSSSLRFNSVVALCGSQESFSEVPARPDGSFCVSLSESQQKEPITIRSLEHLDLVVVPSELAEVQMDPRADFTSSDYVWSLEAPDSSLELGVVGSGFPALASFELSLECGSRNYPLGSFQAATDGPTYLRLASQPEFPTERCRLSLSGHFKDLARASAASTNVILERPVHLAVITEDSTTYEVAAKTRDQVNAAGMIEVRGKDGRYVAGANVVGGKATLELSHVAPEDLSLIFLPSAPWFRTGPSLQLHHKPNPSWYLHSGVHLALLVSFLAWLAHRLLKKTTPSNALSVESIGAVEVIEVPRDKRVHGTVRDAHTQEALAARVELFRKGAQGNDSLEAVETGEDGTFSFKAPSGALLEVVATSPKHLTLVAPVRRGQAEIRLVARRRALLAQIEAVLRGRPELRPSTLIPTPEQLRREANLDDRPEDERWAEAIDQLAYGPEEPEEAAVSGVTPPTISASPQH